MTYTQRLTILGCGSSGGVPRVNGDWGICDPSNPKNQRTRCSVLFQQWHGEGQEPPIDNQVTNILFDTSPDLRAQLIPLNINHLDAIFYTHEHADQSHGIDDVRAIAYSQRSRIPTFMDAYNYEHVARRFAYCFEQPEGRNHPPILDLQEPFLTSGAPVTVSGRGGKIDVLPLEMSHGSSPVLGFRMGPVAYAPDVHEISDVVFEHLDGIDCFVVDALRYHRHPTHAHADRALQWGARLAVKDLVLTNLHIDMDYAALLSELPKFARPAYDGLSVRFNL